MNGKMFINSNKILSILFLFSLPFFCAFSYIEKCRKIEIKVDNIDSTTLKDAYLIFFTSKKKKGVIYSKKLMQDSVKCTYISSQVSYKITINKIFKVVLADNISFSLYKNDIYLNGKLVFKKETEVFSSDGINGLCLTMK